MNLDGATAALYCPISLSFPHEYSFFFTCVPAEVKVREGKEEVWAKTAIMVRSVEEEEVSIIFSSLH